MQNKQAKFSCDYLVVLIFSSSVFFYKSESKWKGVWEASFNEPKQMQRRLDLMSYLTVLTGKPLTKKNESLL